MEIRELTKAEEEIMQVLWNLGKGFIKDILEQLPEPKPAYNTVSTIVRILETKGFIGHTEYGRTHQYHCAIDKDAYRAFATTKIFEGYFDNSVKEMLSFFVNEKGVSIKELDEMLEIIKNMKS
jgi:BlaI family transcriptional regulator, penicillinase repressor